jgi:hypothetical protein
MNSRTFSTGVSIVTVAWISDVTAPPDRFAEENRAGLLELSASSRHKDLRQLAIERGLALP